MPTNMFPFEPERTDASALVLKSEKNKSKEDQTCSVTMRFGDFLLLNDARNWKSDVVSYPLKDRRSIFINV